MLITCAAIFVIYLPAPHLDLIMANEPMLGLPRSAKRGRMQEELSSGSASAAPNAQRGATSSGTYAGMFGNLEERVGEGPHARPLMEAVLEGMKDLTKEVQELKANTCMSWEVDLKSAYLDKAMEMKDVYVAKCKEVRGQGKDLGNIRNYVFIGLYLTYLQDKDVSLEDRRMMEDLVGAKIRDGSKTLNLDLAPNLNSIVAVCTVVRTKKKGFVNLEMKKPAAQLLEIMGKALDREGKQQHTLMHMHPVHADLN